MSKEEKSIFNFPVSFVPRGGGAPVEAWLTPSDWARADEWADELRAASLHEVVEADEDGEEVVSIVSSHTDAWIAMKMSEAARLTAAQAAGLMRPGPVSLELIMEMNNLYEVKDMPDAEGADVAGENPTGDGAGA